MHMIYDLDMWGQYVFSIPYYTNNVLLVLKGYSSQGEVHSVNLHMYTILVVPSNCAQRTLINN